MVGTIGVMEESMLAKNRSGWKLLGYVDECDVKIVQMVCGD